MFNIFSIRWKIILAFIDSFGISFAFIVILIEVVRHIGLRNRFTFFYNVMVTLEKRVGVVPVGVLVGIVVFILVFFIISRRTILYLETISRTLQQVSLGRLDLDIPVRSSDEIGELAENINMMANRLRKSIDEERAAEAGKNELITNVSHDLRTPLTSILGYLEIIEKSAASSDAALSRYAGIACDKAIQMKTLIDDLFEFTRISSGGLKLNTEWIDAKELLDQVAESFYPELEAAGMKSRLVASSSEVKLYADGALLVRALENLISNAIRYGSEGKFMDLELEESENEIAIRVVNYGNPIEPHDLEHVFDRFYRVEKSRSGSTGGAGLGLAIVKQIVDLHKGTITASSGKERTVFEIELNRDRLSPERKD